VTFEDLVEGRAWVERIATVPKREQRRKQQRHVTFDVDEENIE